MTKSEKLQNILEQLTDLLFRTWSAFLVAKNLDPFIDNSDFAQKHYFLVSAYVSCVESTLLGFSKLMSKKDEVSINYLLNVCNQEASACTQINQPDVKSVIQKHRQQLEKLDPLVQDVKWWRDKAIAHHDRKHINDPATIANKESVDLDKVGENLILLQDIINVYRERLGLGLQRLKDYEPRMANEWKNLVELLELDDQSHIK